MSFQAVSSELYSRYAQTLSLWNKSFLVQNVVPLKAKYNKMLDLGCGTGQNTHLFATFFKADCIVAIDKNATFIEYAGSQDSDVNNVYQICDFDKDEDLRQVIKDHPDVDLVISSFALQWLDDPISLFKVLSPLLKSSTEHVHVVPTAMYEPVQDVLDNIPKARKWQTYLQNCPIHHCLDREPSLILSSGFVKEFSDLPYKILREVRSEMIMKCPTHEEDLEFLKLILPFTKYIPVEMQDEFINDCWEELLKTASLEDGKVPWHFDMYLLHAQSV